METMTASTSDEFKACVEGLYRIVQTLEKMFPDRPFTPDGHMVGSLGECIVADAYGLRLMAPSNEGYDAITAEGLKVEIKTTQAKSVAFRSVPDHCIVIKLLKDGSFKEIFNGPGSMLDPLLEAKKPQSNGQRQLSLSQNSNLYSTGRT